MLDAGSIPTRYCMSPMLAAGWQIPAPCPLHGGTWCPQWGRPEMGKALPLSTLYLLFSAKPHRTGHQFLVKTCFPSWELAFRKGNSELPRNALAF